MLIMIHNLSAVGESVWRGSVEERKGLWFMNNKGYLMCLKNTESK